MSTESPERPILKRKTTHAIMYVGAIGWTAFILTTTLWVNSAKSKKRYIKAHQEAKDQHEVQMDYLDKVILKYQVSDKKQSQRISKLEKYALSSEKQKEQLIASEAAKTKAEQKKLHALFNRAMARLSKLELSEINFWANEIQKYQTDDQLFIQEFHSHLAERYFALSQIEKTKNHLKLSQNFSPEQITRLNSQLDINLAVEAVKRAISSKQNSKQIKQKFTTAYALLTELPNDKKEQSDRLYSDLINLEIKLALSFPAKESLPALTSILAKLRKKCQKTDCGLPIKTHYLRAATDAFILSNAYTSKSESQKYKAEVEKAIQTILTKHPSHEPAHAAASRLLLIELDSLFMEAEPPQITAKIQELEKRAKDAGKETKTIMLAAADGHKAALFFEKGQITNASNTLKTAIRSIQSINESSEFSPLAMYRLGILLWLQSQLTNSSDVKFKSLNDSANILSKALEQDTKRDEHNIRQFLAMVEGDLGHHTAENGRNDLAKKHFSHAIKQWKIIIKTWGITEEAKEGLKFCEWRVNQL